MNDLIMDDAREFGRYEAHGGWVQGLRVARSVLSTEEGRKVGHANIKRGKVPGNQGRPEGRPEKVTAQAFGEAAGIQNAASIRRYYDAWQAAAAESVVPDAETLKPGDEVKLPEAELWGGFYASTERYKEDQEQSGKSQFLSAAKADPGLVVRAFDALPIEQREMVVQDIVQHREFAEAVTANPVVRDEMIQNVLGTPEQRQERREESHREAIGRNPIHGWTVIVEAFGGANRELLTALNEFVRLTLHAERGVDPNEDPLALARGRGESIGRTIHEIEMAWGESPITDKIEELRAAAR